MNKNSLAALALALPLTIGTAWATTTTLGSFTHNYGNGAGQVDPGGTDALSDGYVTVTDPKSTGSNRFTDAFDLSGLSFSSISAFKLTLTYSGINGGFLNLAEKWYVRPGGTTAYWTNALSNSNATNAQTFTFTSSTNTFSSMVASKSFYYWFAEETSGSDAFKLQSAKLDVVGAVPEPESYAMLVAGLALMGTIARRRKGHPA